MPRGELLTNAARVTVSSHVCFIPEILVTFIGADASCPTLSTA